MAREKAKGENALDKGLVDDILTYLSGTYNKVESISFLKKALMQDYGWRRLGNLSDFEDKLKDLGFEVTYVYNKKNPNILRERIVGI